MGSIDEVPAQGVEVAAEAVAGGAEQEGELVVGVAVVMAVDAFVAGTVGRAMKLRVLMAVPSCRWSAGVGGRRCGQCGYRPGHGRWARRERDGGRGVAQVHADPVRDEPEGDGLDAYGAVGLAVGGGEEERGLVGQVLGSVDVQGFPGFLRDVLVRRSERSVLVTRSG